MKYDILVQTKKTLTFVCGDFYWLENTIYAKKNWGKKLSKFVSGFLRLKKSDMDHYIIRGGHNLSGRTTKKTLFVCVSSLTANKINRIKKGFFNDPGRKFVDNKL